MKKTPPIAFAGSQLSEARHVCAFFNSAEEEYRVLMPFIQGGFESGHKAIHLVYPCQCLDHIQRLIDAGIDVTATQRSGQLELRTNLEVYLQDGRFDQDRMFEMFEQLSSGNDKIATKNGGMGIGLPVSRSIIENLQGRISAKPNDGPGATFSFSIPRSAGRGIEGTLA